VKKTLPINRIIVTIILLCVAVSGVYLTNVNESLNQDGECDITNNTCELRVFNQVIRVKFEQRPVTEEELSLNFSHSDTLTIKNAWVVGVNMYMGKTPVLFENPKRSERAVVFLGSCNLQEMHWRLYANIKNSATDEVALVYVTFSTYYD
jgi:hypothetical protein